MIDLSYRTTGYISSYAAVTAWLSAFIPTPHDAEQTTPVPCQQITPDTRPSYVLGNTGMPIRVDAALTGDPVVDNYRPRTELGRKLLSLRRAYVTSGGQLLDGTALDAEVQLRRGGVADV